MIEDALDARFPETARKVKLAETIIERHLECGITSARQIMKTCRDQGVTNQEIQLARKNLRIQAENGRWRGPKTPQREPLKSYLRNLLKDGPVSSNRMRKLLSHVPTGTTAKIRKELGIKTKWIEGERCWILQNHSNKRKIMSSPPIVRAREYIGEMLRHGPVTPEDLFQQAEGLSMQNLYQARREMGVQTTRIGGILHWVKPNEEITHPKTKAAGILREALKDGPLSANQINRLARQNDIAKTTLNRARDQLRIQVVWIDETRHWQLPKEQG